MLIHSIEGGDVMLRLSVAPKLNANPDVLTRLCELGRARAEAWLTSDREPLGIESMIDVRAR